MFPSTKAQSFGHCPWTESYLARYAEDSPAPGNSLMWTNSNSGWSYARRNARRPMRPKPGRLTGRWRRWAIDRQSWAPRSLFTDDRGGGAGFDPWGRWAPRVDAGRSGRRCVRTVDANLDHDIRAWIHALWEVRRVGLRLAKKILVMMEKGIYNRRRIARDPNLQSGSSQTCQSHVFVKALRFCRYRIHTGLAPSLPKQRPGQPPGRVHVPRPFTLIHQVHVQLDEVHRRDA